MIRNPRLLGLQKENSLILKVSNSVFEDSIEHIYAELRVINLYMKKLVLSARSRDALWERRDLRGLYISDKEVSYLVGTDMYPGSPDLFDSSPESVAIGREIAAAQEEIRGMETTSIAAGLTLRLHKIQEIFKLDGFEKNVLLFTLLPEVASYSERIFGYIQDDVTRRRPTVSLALDAFCTSNAEKLNRRAAFLPGSPLIKHRLVLLYDDNSRKGSSLLSMSLKLDGRIADYLLGLDSPDPALLPWVSVHQIDMLSGLNYNGNLTEELAAYISSITEDGVHIFSSVGGINETNLIQSVSLILKSPVLIADFSHMLEIDPDPVNAVRLLRREADLTSSAIYGRNFDAVISHKQSGRIITELEEFYGKLIISGDNWNSLALPWNRRIPVPFRFSIPNYEQREALWRSHSGPDMQIADSIVMAVTGKFQLTGNQIEKAIRLALGLSRQQGETSVSEEALLQACRMISATRLMEVARKITPRYRFSDIVLSPEPSNQLQDILDYVNYRHTVLDKWGFRQKSSLGRGLNILFSGTSGTGKTMAAEIIASEMGLDLYKIDLSVVVSKYIGETEKNLDRVFKEAVDSNCVLFFDEADALFGKRSEVRDSHDRYANIEIAYLLQKMEEYEGIVILATNLKKNVDEAFARRMHFSIEFPSPEQEYRLLIWQKSFPAEAPVSPNINMDFLSRQFRLTGGNIKNIALTAAFQAVKKGRPICMDDLIVATSREYQKTGKLVTEAEFGKYYALVKQQGRNEEI